jgi:hypothetical protein
VRRSVAEMLAGMGRTHDTQFTCFTSAKVQMLTTEEPEALRAPQRRRDAREVLNLLALLVHKYKF